MIRTRRVGGVVHSHRYIVRHRCRRGTPGLFRPANGGLVQLLCCCG